MVAQPDRLRFGMFGSRERTCHAMHFAIVNGCHRVQLTAAMLCVWIWLCVLTFRAVFDGESVDRDLARIMSCTIAKRPKIFVRIWIINFLIGRGFRTFFEFRIGFGTLRYVTLRTDTQNLIWGPHSVPPYTPYTTELVVAGSKAYRNDQLWKTSVESHLVKYVEFVWI